MNTPERDVARTVIRWLRIVLPVGSTVASIVNEQRGASSDRMARMRFGAARKASGIVTGFPDAVAAIPGGRAIWLEFKRPDGGVISAAQAEVHQALRALDHPVLIVQSIETCRAGLLSLGLTLREAEGQAVAAPKVRVAKPRTRMPADKLPW